MQKYRKIMAMLCVMTMVLSGCGSRTASQEETTAQDTVAETVSVQETAESSTEIQMQQSVEVASESESATENDTAEIEGQTTQPTEEALAEADAETENVLIAYFTWADNTHVEDPASVDVDATTSASVLAPGNIGLIASWIHEEIGGDVFSIQVQEPYSSDYDECLDRASEENAQNARPALATHVENMEQYDTVYIGYPNWWYSCPMALLTFLEEYDLSGKHIVLFCSHGTGGLAGSVEAIRAVLPADCTVEENVLGVYRPEVASSQDAVLTWLQEVK